MTDQAVADLAGRIGVRDACLAVGASQAGYYRRHRVSPAPERPAPIPHRERPQPRALSAQEQQAILDVLHSDRFVDMSPAQVWATLLDEGVYLGSQSTFYRLLRQAGEVRERRAQAHPSREGETRTRRQRAESGVVVGHNEVARPSEMDLLLPLRDLGHLFPLRRRLDGRQPRIRRVGRGADPPDLRQAGNWP